MGITDAFDPQGEEIIQARNNVQAVEDFPPVVLSVFSEKFLHLLLKRYEAREIASLCAGGRALSIYTVAYKEKTFAFFHTGMGGAACAALLEEIIALGGEKILYFGSCGVLDKTVAQGGLLIPTAAYRDEGVSYHYAPPGDYLEVETAAALSRIFDELRLPYRLTKTWTTDAFYRETRGNLEKRRAEGCAVVEMECASLMAVGRFRKKKVYQFLYAADCLDAEHWDPRLLGKMPDDFREKLLSAALEIAARL